MKLKKVASCCVCFALAAAVLAGCGKPGETKPSGNLTETTVPVETTIPEESTVPPETAEPTQETEPTFPVVPDHVVVGTAYGYLQFHDQWMEFMKTEQQTEGDVVHVFFTAVINDMEYPLFTITIGGDGGEPICQMTDANGVTRPVYVQVEEIGDISALDEGEQDRLFAMQEEINYIIENIK